MYQGKLTKRTEVLKKHGWVHKRYLDNNRKRMFVHPDHPEHFITIASGSNLYRRWDPSHDTPEAREKRVSWTHFYPEKDGSHGFADDAVRGVGYEHLDNYLTTFHQAGGDLINKLKQHYGKTEDTMNELNAADYHALTHKPGAGIPPMKRKKPSIDPATVAPKSDNDREKLMHGPAKPGKNDTAPDPKARMARLSPYHGESVEAMIERRMAKKQLNPKAVARPRSRDTEWFHKGTREQTESLNELLQGWNLHQNGAGALHYRNKKGHTLSISKGPDRGWSHRGAKGSTSGTGSETLSAHLHKIAHESTQVEGFFFSHPIQEVAPPGWSGTVKAMKKHSDIDNPFALAWYMKKHGAKSHVRPEEVSFSREDLRVVTEVMTELGRLPEEERPILTHDIANDPDAFKKWMGHPETQKAFAKVRRGVAMSMGKDPDRAEWAYRRWAKKNPQAPGAVTA